MLQKGHYYQKILEITQKDPFTIDNEDLIRYNEKLSKYLKYINTEKQ